MNLKIDHDILIAYLNGELDVVEKEAVESWMQTSDDNRKLVEQLYYTMFVSERIEVMNSIDVEASLNNLKKQIRERGRSSTGKPLSFYIRKAAIAAAFIGVLLMGSIFLRQVSMSYSNPFIITTNLGERAQATLPDGSKVWIGSCSKLEYYTSVFAKERKVNLIGEAYFEVKNDRNKPFIVNSNEMRTEVLGTKFNIKANADEQFVIATLLEGSIKISATENSEDDVIMKPKNQLKFDRRTKKSNLYICPTAEEYISWINGKLHFDQTSLKDISISLERYYNVEIIIKSDRLKQELFTCDFDTKENIYQILSVLKMTNKFDYKVNNRTIEIIEKK